MWEIWEIWEDVGNRGGVLIVDMEVASEVGIRWDIRFENGKGGSGGDG